MVRVLYHSLPETGHLYSASAQNGYSRLETTELSGVLAFDHERDKKTHTCQCYFIINSSWCTMSRWNVFIAISQWGGLYISVIQHTEELALRVVDASSICIKANTRAPLGRANTVVMGVIREIGSNPIPPATLAHSNQWAFTPLNASQTSFNQPWEVRGDPGLRKNGCNTLSKC